MRVLALLEPALPRHLTPQRLARLLDVPVSWLEEWSAAGKIPRPSVSRGRHSRYHVGAVRVALARYFPELRPADQGKGAEKGSAGQSKSARRSPPRKPPRS